MNYPFYPGSHGSDTSDAAAEAIASVTGRIRRRVLVALVVAPFGLTAHEVAEELGCENTTTQPRLTELSLMGLIQDAGTRRRNKSGHTARVWIATAKGRAILAASPQAGEV